MWIHMSCAPTRWNASNSSVMKPRSAFLATVTFRRSTRLVTYLAGRSRIDLALA